MPELELYGTAACPYTQELSESLEWKGREFVEFDIELDAQARARLQALVPPPWTVPVLVQDGKVIQVGWQGRGCVVVEK
jgi:glutaredoxin